MGHLACAPISKRSPLSSKEGAVCYAFGELIQTDASRIRTVDILRGDCFFSTTPIYQRAAEIIVDSCRWSNRSTFGYNHKSASPLAKGRGIQRPKGQRCRPNASRHTQ